MTYETITLIGKLLESEKRFAEKELEIANSVISDKTNEAEKAEFNGETCDYNSIEEWKDTRNMYIRRVQAASHALEEFKNHQFR